MRVPARPPEPPEPLRRILRASVGASEADAVDAELTEDFRARAERDGLPVARRWYLRQVVGFAARLPLLGRRGTRPAAFARLGLEDLTRDLRWAVRGLLRRRSFTAAAVLTLALGIGALSAVFTLLSAHFLTPLPYERPNDVVLLWETGRNTTDLTTVAPGSYFAWREEAASLSDVAAYNVDAATLSDGAAAAERVSSSVVTANFFDVLGARALHGVTFDEDAARAADGFLVVLGHSLWTRRYGADPAVVGTDIRIDGRPHRVVGVMPPRFRQPERELMWQRPELWRVLLLDDQRDNFEFRYLRAVARLAPGATLEEARTELEGVAERLARAHPESNAGRTVLVYTLAEYLLGDVRPTLLALLAAGAAVFILVCANVANLTLARGEERQREFALRAVLGSGHRRLLRQLLLEGVVLAGAGAALGSVLVYAASDLLQAVQSRFFTGLVDVRVDVRVIAFTALAALLAGVLSGLPVAGAAMRADVRRSLVGGTERSTGGTLRARSFLVVGQVGLATSLAAVAALLTRSFNELVSVDPGFEHAGVMTFVLVAPPEWQGRDGVTRYFREVWTELGGIPGVEDVGMISDMPFTTENRGSELIFDDRPPNPLDPPGSEYHSVTPEYFRVMDIPLLSGRLPGESWEREVPVPVVVNEAMAERFWPEGDVLGATFRRAEADSIPLTVRGVVGDVLDDGYSAGADPAFFMPYGSMVQRGMSLVLRVGGEPGAVASAVREAVARVDPDAPAADLRMLGSLLAETVVRPRAASLIGVGFAAMALLIAAAGIYGVLSYTVQSRTREIGIRAALGASRQQLVRMVMGQSSRLILFGLMLGWIGAVVGGRAMAGILFGVRAWDPVSLATASVLLALAGTAASWLPARRAVRVDPRDALRAE